MEQTAPLPEKGRLAGIDFGTVRIGIAVCDPDRIIASPYEIYTRKNEIKDAEFFLHFVQEEKICGLVIGLPLHFNGELSDKAREAIAFGTWLANLTKLPVAYMDERYSSVEAESFLRDAKMTRKKRKARIDKIAAQIFLAAFIDGGCIGTTNWKSLED